jgi:hypothetical protein
MGVRSCEGPLPLEGDQVAVVVCRGSRKVSSGTGVAGNERAEQAFLPMLYGCLHRLRLARVVAARWCP